MGLTPEKFDDYLERVAKPFLAEKAREAAEKAKNYRGCTVGSAVLAVNFLSSGKIDTHVFVGTNLMLKEGGQKFCAEMVAIMSAIANGFEHIMAIAVAGPPQPDDASGADLGKIIPCEDCREVMQGLDEVTEDTVIFLMTNHGDEPEPHTFGQILQEAYKAKKK